ncbi:hypothetical protein JNL27_07290 [bacterium]|nr:hypothetical protein [bacterium]
MKNENIRKTVGGKPLPSRELKKMFDEFVKKNGLLANQNKDISQRNDSPPDKK